MEGEDDNAYLRQRIIQFNHGHKDRTNIIHRKSKYLNRMDEAFETICNLISPYLLFHISSCKTPNESWNTMEGLFGKHDNASSRKRIIWLNHEHRYKTHISHRKIQVYK